MFSRYPIANERSDGKRASRLEWSANTFDYYCGKHRRSMQSPGTSVVHRRSSQMRRCSNLVLGFAFHNNICLFLRYALLPMLIQSRSYGRAPSCSVHKDCREKSPRYHYGPASSDRLRLYTAPQSPANTSLERPHYPLRVKLPIGPSLTAQLLRFS